jgi:5-methylcytosine-specific restriction endonuclease McrA
MNYFDFIPEEKNKFSKELDRLNAKSEDIHIKISRIKSLWNEISRDISLKTETRMFLNKFFEATNLKIKDTSRDYVFKKILEILANNEIVNYKKIYLYVIMFAIFNYKKIEDPIIGFNTVYFAFNALITDIIKAKMSYMELAEFLTALTLLIQLVYPDEKLKINKLMRKIVRKKIPEDDVSERIIDDIMKRKEKIMKSGNYGVDLTLNPDTLELLYKVADIEEEIEELKSSSEKEDEELEESFSFSLYEENTGKAKKAKDKWNDHKKKLKRQGKWKQPTTCSKCGKKTSKLEAAHSNYDKPLSVRWLCKSCHGKENKKFAKKRGAQGKYNPTGKWPKKYKKKTNEGFRNYLSGELLDIDFYDEIIEEVVEIQEEKDAQIDNEHGNDSQKEGNDC